MSNLPQIQQMPKVVHGVASYLDQRDGVIYHKSFGQYGEGLCIRVGDATFYGPLGRDYIELPGDGEHLHLDDVERHINALQDLAMHLRLARDPDGDRDPGDECEFDAYLLMLERNCAAERAAKVAA